MLRLLSILSVRAHGATQHELTVLEGVRANLIYKAVMLDLVTARPEHQRHTAIICWLPVARFCHPITTRLDAKINPAILRTTSRAGNCGLLFATIPA